MLFWQYGQEGPGICPYFWQMSCIFSYSSRVFEIGKGNLEASGVDSIGRKMESMGWTPILHKRSMPESRNFSGSSPRITMLRTYSFHDIFEIIDDYIQNESFRHILLGGGSSNPDSNFEEIIRLAEYLKRKTEKPLYLMSLPPKDLDIIPKLYEAGISEIAFNIEIFQETWALRYMPGKGKIPRSYYYEALEKSKIWRKDSFCI